MAGAGYKLFNTGDVLTAAQVNTYLMEQSVMVFADAAARTTALTGVVAEGMLSYLKDTNAVEVYNGSAWVASDDPNAIQNTIVDAKGDLITATAADTPARLAAGNNGETLVADSAATTGLRWQGDYAAGKNKVINGDFGINQRNFTSTTANEGFGFDRFNLRTAGTGGTSTWSAQVFTPGTAPVAGYESTNYSRIITSGFSGTDTIVGLRQKIEDVRTLAGQTVVVSFWAKAASGTPNVGVQFAQIPIGSTSVAVSLGLLPITTSWARYSFTTTLPSLTGVTISAGSSLQLAIYVAVGTGISGYGTTIPAVTVQNNTFEIWGVQVEAGSVATAFQTATGTLQGELALAQRYYIRYTTPEAYSTFANGGSVSTTQARFQINYPVEMRVKPTAIEYSTLGVAEVGDSVLTATSVTLNAGNNKAATLLADVASGLTKYRACNLYTNNSTSAYLAFTAEL